MAYSYMKLSSPSTFRVMEVISGLDDQEITVKLHEADWNNPPSYDAISYAWGDNTVRTTISCEGCDLNVTPNLKDCLRQLRSKQSSRCVWADAVCIDQTNMEERGQQVRHMRKIYENARRVVVWLGNDEEGKAERASTAVTDLSLLWCANTGISLQDLGSMENIFDVVQDLDHFELDFDSQTVDSLSWLFQRSWFSRLWVLQEVVNAKEIDVQCGTQYFTWDHVCLVATFMKATAHLLNDTLRNTYFNNVYIMRCRDYHTRLSAPAILDWVREFQATDLLDRIYAMLGFTAFIKAVPRIEVDYGLSKMKLYTDVAAQMIEMDGLAILSYVQHLAVVDDDSPTWVPCWDRKYFSYTIGYAKPDTTWSASRSLGPRTAFDLSQTVFKVGGIEVDTCNYAVKIEVVGPEWFKSTLLNLCTSQRFPLVESPTGKTRLEVLAATLVAGRRVIDKCQCCDEERIMCCDLAAYIVECNDTDGNGNEISSEIKDLAAHGDWRAFKWGARDYCWHRSLFSTKKGYCGLGSNCIQPGDIVCILFGGIVPYVLRPKGNTNTYQFLGEAYIHGLMHGEAIDTLQRGELEERVFEIC